MQINVLLLLSKNFVIPWPSFGNVDPNSTKIYMFDLT